MIIPQNVKVIPLQTQLDPWITLETKLLPVKKNFALYIDRLSFTSDYRCYRDFEAFDAIYLPVVTKNLKLIVAYYS